MQGERRELGRRAGGYLIDFAIIWAPSVLLFLTRAHRAPVGTADVYGGNNYIRFALGHSELYVVGSDVELIAGVLGIMTLVICVLIPTLTGASPGMRAVGLKVVGEDGGAVRAGRHLVRTLLWAIDGFPYVLPGVAFLTAATSSRGQRVGDMVARTRVVRVGS